MASASNVKKKYCHKVCTENENVGRVSCQRHRAYTISNAPAVKPNKIRSRTNEGSSNRLNTSRPSSSPRSIDKIDELSAAVSNISPPFCRGMGSTTPPPAWPMPSLPDEDV